MIYEYRCTECGHIFSRSFPFTKNPPATACPECPGGAERYFGTVPPICFKGQGWASKSELDPHDPKNDRPLDFGPAGDPGDTST